MWEEGGSELEIFKFPGVVNAAPYQPNSIVGNINQNEAKEV